MSQPAPMIPAEATADVIVVGAGPAGSAVATHLANAGRDVLLLEKSHFPREKVCGQALTPRAVRELISLGVPTEEDHGWTKNKGVRVIGGGMRLQLDWPDVAGFPPFGLVRKQHDLDEFLAQHAQSKGVRLLQGVDVTAARTDDSGRITWVEADELDESDEPTGKKLLFTAPLVVAADGAASAISRSMGREASAGRPTGLALHATFRTPRHDDDHLEAWLDLAGAATDGKTSVLPGYAWIFGAGDGTSNVGLTVLRPEHDEATYRDVLQRWLATLPAEWNLTEEAMVGPVRAATLPTGFNRAPLYTDGLLLVGDAAGAANPFTGEGVAAALESGRLAAEVISQAFARTDEAGRERVLQSYSAAMRHELGGYYTMGRLFAKMIDNPNVMRLGVKYALPRQSTMRFMLKMVAGLGQTRGGKADDRTLAMLARLTPAA